MELWATGFNAWNQLSFEDGADLTSNPVDFNAFKPILEDDSIEVLRTSASSLLIRSSTGLKTTGSPDDFITFCVEQQNHFPNLALAGNGKIAGIDGTLTEFPSLSAFKASEGTSLRPFARLQQLVANQTTFTALASSGSVYTWGDARYPSCLARKPSESCEATSPCLVEDLLDLPSGRVCKLASGGYTTAALTTANDMYFWGGRSGQPRLLDEMDEYPTPVDVDDVDWADVDVGENHAIALSMDGKVWVAGDNGNGQLGLGSGVDDVRKWEEVKLNLRGKKVGKVFAGYKNSFLVLDS